MARAASLRSITQAMRPTAHWCFAGYRVFAIVGSEVNADRGPGMADVKLIPLKVLLGNPEQAAAQISPDGKRLSYLAPAGHAVIDRVG
jgi:hypothetical protein